MNVPTPEPVESPEAGNSWKPISFWRLASKELRETLRDRRTIITLFLMPLIVYPILSLLFQGFIASGFRQTQSVGGETEVLNEDQFVFLFESEEDFNRVAPVLNSGYTFLQREQLQQKESRKNPGRERKKKTPAGVVRPQEIDFDLFGRHNFQLADEEQDLTLQEMISTSMADVGVQISRSDASQGRRRPVDFTLLYREDDVRSVTAVRFFESILNSINVGTLKGALGTRGIRFDSPVNSVAESVSRPQPRKPGISFAAVIPLVLTLMTITGAVYPAIDLTAGERERGTLESLIAAPIPRMRILLGKLIAIVAVALLTALVNLLGMTITLWVFQFDRALFGEQGLTVLTFFKILGLLTLFAIFFSSVLLVITSFARSFKEGQAYLIPLMMVALAPSLMSLKPDLALAGVWTVTPLVNIVLLARDVLSGNAMWPATVVTIGTTIFYSALAITMAARFFGTAKVLYGNDQGIGTLFRRPRETRFHASASLAMLCLALLFPASFIWQGLYTRLLNDSTIIQKLWFGALGLTIVFFLIPWMVSQYHRVRFLPGFGIRRPSVLAIVAGVLMGLGFGPLLLQAIFWCAQLLEMWGVSDETITRSLVQRGEETVRSVTSAPLWLLLVTMAVVPAVTEELFFRGLLFRAIRSTLSPWKTIFATAVMFGVFHLIDSSGLMVSRLLPTTLLGVILGWVCYRSGSVIPCILFHTLYNSLTLSLGYYRDSLIENEWITKDQTSIPIAFVGTGLVMAVAGVWILATRKIKDSPAGEIQSADDRY